MTCETFLDINIKILQVFQNHEHFEFFNEFMKAILEISQNCWYCKHSVKIVKQNVFNLEIILKD
jgi:hypothetical protein